MRFSIRLAGALATFVFSARASAQWQAGVSFDTLVVRYHDRDAQEETGSLQPFERDKLPDSYKAAFEGNCLLYTSPSPRD